MPASGPRSRGARGHPPPHQGLWTLPRRSAASGLVLATQKLGGVTGWGTDGPPELLVRPDRRPLERVLPARGLRFRRRDAAAVRTAERERARREVRVDRAGLGRQRGLARRRGRGDVRSLPRLVRDDVLGLLPGVPAAPLLPDRPRRLVRVARKEREPGLAPCLDR